MNAYLLRDTRTLNHVSSPCVLRMSVELARLVVNEYEANVIMSILISFFQGYNMLTVTLGTSHKRTKQMGDVISRVKKCVNTPF